MNCHGSRIINTSTEADAREKHKNRNDICSLHHHSDENRSLCKRNTCTRSASILNSWENKLVSFHNRMMFTETPERNPIFNLALYNFALHVFIRSSHSLSSIANTDVCFLRANIKNAYFPSRKRMPNRDEWKSCQHAWELRMESRRAKDSSSIFHEKQSCTRFKKKSFNFAKRLFHYVCMWIASIKSGWDVGFKNHKWWCLYASVPLYLATCFFPPPTFHLLNPLEFTHWSVMEKGFDGSPLFNCNEKLYSSFLYSLSTLFFHFIRSIKIMMRINDEKSAGETALNLIHLVFDAKRILL